MCKPQHKFQIVSLSKVHALEIFRWRYPLPYDFYNPPESNNPELLLDTTFQFHAIVDDNNQFLGFCSFGIDGQVSGGNYSMPAIDIGLGMKPSLTGQGFGSSFFKAILDFAINNYEAEIVRLSVANFNQRALSLYKNFGFQAQQTFNNPNNDVDYTILTLKIKK